MATIKYEIQNIHNVAGSGKERPFIRLRNGKALSVNELAERVAEACTATKSDLLAIMTELRHIIVNELAQGNRVYLPEIGYLSLSVGNVPPSKKKDGKITGKDIYLKNIDFQPEKQLLKELQGKVHFEKSSFSTVSTQYTPEEMWQKTFNYLLKNKYITCRKMASEFGLTNYIARKWLTRFVNDGKLIKEGTHHQPLYFKA